MGWVCCSGQTPKKIFFRNLLLVSSLQKGEPSEPGDVVVVILSDFCDTALKSQVKALIARTYQLTDRRKE